MRELNLDVAGEFMVMAATLIHIKSKMLVPIEPTEAEGEEEYVDPREELARRLLEFQRYKEAAGILHQQAQIRAAQWTRPDTVLPTFDDAGEEMLEAGLYDLIAAFKEMLDRRKALLDHEIESEGPSIEDRMVELLAMIGEGESLEFLELFAVAGDQGRDDHDVPGPPGAGAPEAGARLPAGDVRRRSACSARSGPPSRAPRPRRRPRGEEKRWTTKETTRRPRRTPGTKRRWWTRALRTHRPPRRPPTTPRAPRSRCPGRTRTRRILARSRTSSVLPARRRARHRRGAGLCCSPAAHRPGDRPSARRACRRRTGSRPSRSCRRTTPGTSGASSSSRWPADGRSPPAPSTTTGSGSCSTRRPRPGCRSRPWRRWRSSPTGSRSPCRRSSSFAGSGPRAWSRRSSRSGSSASPGARRSWAGPCCTAPRSSSCSTSG